MKEQKVPYAAVRGLLLLALENVEGENFQKYDLSKIMHKFSIEVMPRTAEKISDFGSILPKFCPDFTQKMIGIHGFGAFLTPY